MSLDQKNDAADQTDLTSFIKYSKMNDVMRHHILSYLRNLTLKNYAECSTYCNSEIQRFNTIAPEYVKLTEENDQICVSLAYKSTKLQSGHVNLYRQEKIFKKNFNTMNEIQKHILKCYKYVKEKQTNRLYIDMKNWPTVLMNVNVLARIDDLHVFVYDSMYTDFMEFANNNRLRKIGLSRSFDNEMTISSEFFKTQLFKNADVFTACKITCEIDDNDFIETQHSHIFIESSISFEAIRQKVEKINWGVKTMDQRIEILFGDNDVYDMAVLFPRARFPDQFIFEEEENEKRQIGKVTVSICDGCYLELLVRQ